MKRDIVWENAQRHLKEQYGLEITLHNVQEVYTNMRRVYRLIAYDQKNGWMSLYVDSKILEIEVNT